MNLLQVLAYVLQLLFGVAVRISVKVALWSLLIAKLVPVKLCVLVVSMGFIYKEMFVFLAQQISWVVQIVTAMGQFVANAMKLLNTF